MHRHAFSLTSRMLAVACACVFMLGVLLFLLGMTVGRLAVAEARGTGPSAGTPQANAATPVCAPAMPEH